MAQINLPSPQFPLSIGDGIAAGGSVYIGEVDADPTVLGNRINVTVIDTDGSEVVIAPASQPFVLNSAGMFTYDGSIVQLRTSVNYSISVFNSAGVLQYYFPDSASTADIQTSLIIATATSTPATVAGAGQYYSKSVGGGIEAFYLDGAGNEVQLTSGGQLNVQLPNDSVEVGSLLAGYYLGTVVELESVDNAIDLDWTAGQYFTLTNTETTTISFNNTPLIGDGKGQTILLAIQDAGNFAITLNPESGYTIYVRSSDKPLTYTTDGLDLVLLTIYAEGIIIAVPLYDFVSL